MEHITFGLNSVIPVFTAMGIGSYLGKKRILTGDPVSQTTSLVFYIVFPVKLSLDVSCGNFSECPDIRFVTYLPICTCVPLAVAWTLCVLLVKDRTVVSAVVHNAFRGDFVYLGLPICQSILGRESVPSTITVVIFVLPSYGVLVMTILSYYDPSGWRVSWKRIFKDISTNPMIVVTLVAPPSSSMHVSLPSAVDKVLPYLGQLSTPMVLILIGAETRPSAFADRRVWIMSGAVYRVVVTLLLSAVPMPWLGLNPEQMVIAFVMSAVPSAMNAYIVIKKMGEGGEPGAAVITVSMLLSAVTLLAGIWWLRSMGVV